MTPTFQSHPDWQDEVIAQHELTKPFAPENGQQLKFKPGDRVIYTNAYGVSFVRTVTRLYKPQPLTSLYATGHRYHIDTDCHWMPVREQNLRPA